MSAPTTPQPAGVLDEVGRRALQRRCLTVVVVSQVFGGAGLAAGVTVGALLAQDMLGGEAVAGLPAALFTLGSALAAYSVGRLSNAAGRRNGLAAGFAAGGLGGAGVATAALLDSPVLLFAALFVYGSGTATNLQARYAGTDLAPPQRRGTAVSIAMVATTFGAVAGPNSVEATGRVAEDLGFPPLAGPFLLAALAYGLAGLALFIFLRPDPLEVARALSVSADLAADPDTPTEPMPASTSRHLLIAGGTAMVLTQMAMVAIMTMTPVHMRHHGHSLSEVGFVIGLHIAGMFLPSPLTGILVDRIGRMPMVAASGITLLAAGVLAATAPGDSMTLLTLALVLLGLGWNFGLIAGTALVVDATPLATRARTQGSLDVLIALAGAGGGAMSGWVVAGTDFATLALGGGLLALLLVPMVAWSATTSRLHR
jgi:MFS family permease